MSAAIALIDAHCHLERRTYGDELPQVMARAQQAGVSHFVAVGASDTTRGAYEAVALAQAHASVYAAVGIHPHDVAHADAKSLDEIDVLLAQPKVVCLGEVGLDYHGAHAEKALQRQILATFLRLAQKHNKPIMLHIRQAHEDAWAVLDSVGLPARGGMVHCFTAGPAEAAAYLQRGLHLSVPGIVTFKNAAPLRAALPHIPLDRLLLETDSPYLAPVPYRGKRNEPSYLPATAQAVADTLGLPLATLAAHCTANTRRFFAF